MAHFNVSCGGILSQRDCMCHSQGVSLRSAVGRVSHNMPAPVRRLVPPKVRRRLRHTLKQFGPWEFDYDFTPPDPGPDERIGPPDFVGIGVQKSGTTWWFDLICAHPGARSYYQPIEKDPVQKERHFFTQYAIKDFTDESALEYQKWFPRPEGQLTGEWTPDYIHYLWIPPLLARAAPDAKLLVMLRDPVDRFRSGLTHLLNHGGANDGSTVSAAIDQGFYLASLQYWLRYFDPSRVLVLQYEQCVADPYAQLEATYAFLDLDPTFRPAEIHKPLNATVTGKFEVPPDAIARLVALYAPDVEGLRHQFPQLELSRWPNFAHLGA
jgi:hypothetical protein